MKIVYMLHDGMNYNGGPAVNAVRLLPELQQRGHEVTAIALYYDFPSNAKHLKENGISTITKQYPKYSEDLVRWILQKVKSINPDVFVPNIIPQGGYAARWVKEAGIPTIMTHRSPDGFNRANAQVFATGDRKWACSGLVCVSEYLKDEVLAHKHVHPEVAVIPSGVPNSNYISDQSGTNLRIAYAGRLVEKQKQIIALITSFTEIARHCPKVEFTIIGDGKERERIEKIVKEAGFSSRFFFTGRLIGDNYHQELARQHAIVLMSDYEGIPGALMDGMMCGLIPITFRTEGIEELVQDKVNGFVINNRSQALLHCIHLIEENLVLRKKLSQEARRCVVGNYSLPEAASRWESLFISLIAKSGKRKQVKIPSMIHLPNVPPAIQPGDRRRMDVIKSPRKIAQVLRHYGGEIRKEWHQLTKK